MEDKMTLTQLGCFVGALWSVYLVAYFFIFLFLDQEKPQASPVEAKVEPTTVSQDKQKKVPETKPKPNNKVQEGSQGQKNKKRTKKGPKNSENTSQLNIVEKLKEEIKPLTESVEEVEEGWTL